MFAFSTTFVAVFSVFFFNLAKLFMLKNILYAYFIKARFFFATDVQIRLGCACSVVAPATSPASGTSSGLTSFPPRAPGRPPSPR